LPDGLKGEGLPRVGSNLHAVGFAGSATTQISRPGLQELQAGTA
jgi:hypothetical protein